MDQKYSKESESVRKGVSPLCKAKDIGLESFRVCFEKDPQKCNFSVIFGDTYFCNYILRINIAKELKE